MKTIAKKIVVGGLSVLLCLMLCACSGGAETFIDDPDHGAAPDGGAQGPQGGVSGEDSSFPWESDGQPNYGYDAVVEQGFYDTAEAPSSYFSLDRNTANYAYVRAQIMGEDKVAPDSVRLEELVNYFSYDYPAPEAGEGIAVTPYLADCPWNAEHKLLTLGIRTETAQRTGSGNYVLLVDVSGSMGGVVSGTEGQTRLDLVKLGANKLVDSLGADDHLSIVTYANGAETVLASTAATEENKPVIRNAIAKLTSYGSTYGSGGLERAYAEAEKYAAEAGNSRVVLLSDGDFNVGITDRDELDVQIEQVFAGVNESIVRIRRGSELIQKINDTSPVMMCSLIHKFGKKNRGKSGETDYAGFIEELKRSLPENFSPKGDFYVFVDECHRTQSGKLHKAMETILPDATFIGFTGTPLIKKDKETSLEVFGPYIHRYKFDEAVRDKVVLDLRYEAREVEQNVVQQDRIDAWFEAKTRGLTNVAKAKLKQRWGNLQKMFSSKARLGQIVADIVFDMETKPRLHDGRGNAMLVAGSIYQACKFYELFQETELKGKCAIVTSYEPAVGDIRTETVGDDGETEAVEQYEIYMKMLGGKDPKAFENEVKEKFIKQPEQMKLLIVVDKLLTGFDAPPATYLYIDKSMRDHGLFQAICRVNRLDGEDKEFGYIIDYKDLFRSLENAVADYTSEAFDSYDKEDVSGLLTDRLDKAKEQLEDSLEALRALCEPVAPPKDMVDYYHYFCGVNTEAFDLDELEENMPKREQLYNLSAAALRAFGEVSGELQEKYHYTVEQIKALEREVTYYIKVRDDVRLASGDYVDLKKYDPDMRHLIDTYLSADPSRVLTSFGGATLVELLVDNGISALKDMPASTPKEQEAVAETIENNVGKEIVERTQSNPKYYEKMSALLRELIEKRKNDVINYEEYLRQIVELARRVHKPESGAEYPPEIRESAAKRAFYDHLNGDTVVANQIYDAVMSSKQDNFRGNKIKERKIWRAIRAIVKKDQDADQLLALVKEQSEF